jgi:photosystem II stability/assembly factor-like uncharacterized protein
LKNHRIAGGACVVAGLMLSCLFLMPQAALGGVNVFTNSGPEGGSISSLAIDGSSETVFAGTGANGSGRGGIFRRVSGTSSWERTGLTGIEIYSVRVSPKDPNVMWAATRTGLYRSGDAGVTWIAAPEVTGTQWVAPDPGNVNVVYCPSGDGILKSSDGGRTWVDKPLPQFSSAGDLEFDQTTGVLYAVTSKGLFSTASGGDTWTPVSTPPGYLFTRAFTVDPTRPATLLISLGGRNDGVGEGAYRSTDGGNTWDRMGISYFESLAVSPRDSHTLFAASQLRVFKSTDDGKTFVSTSDPLFMSFSNQIPVVAVAPSGVVYGGGPNGIFQSTDDGATWQHIIDGLVATDVCSTTVDPASSKKLYAGTQSGLFASADGGETWGTAIGPSDPFNAVLPICNLVVNPIDPKTLVVTETLGYSYVYRSTDGGLTWMKGSEFGSVVGLAIDPSRPDNVYLADNYSDGLSQGQSRVFKSLDGGITWSRTGLPNPGFPIHILLLVPGNPAAVIVGTSGHVFVSTDGGSSWADRPIDFEADAIAADQSHPGWLYAAGAGGPAVAFSADWGLTWVPRNQGLPQLGTFSVSALTLDQSSPSDLFASLRAPVGSSPVPGNPAVFHSGDGGLTWIPFSDGIINPEGTSLVADKGQVVVGTPGSGVWTLTSGGAPRLDSISPTSGSMDGGTLVVLKGDGFRSDSVVMIGGVATREFAFFDAQTIRIRTGAHAVGPADVVVANSDGSSASLPGAFRYEDWYSCSVFYAGNNSGGTVLCLENGRFRVDVDWSDSRRPIAGKGHAEPLTIKSGYFWFEWNQDPQVIVKVLDGRTQNGHYWIHVAAMTDLEFTVYVTDTTTGRVKTYRNPVGQTTATLDRESF